LWGWSNYLI